MTDTNGDDKTPPDDRKNTSGEDRREDNRSAVRMKVTYVATGFLFVVGAALVGYFITSGKPDDGKDIFLAILPIASAVITYWFASRQSGSSEKGGKS